MRRVSLELSGEKERSIKWLLGRRFGKRKGLKVLIVLAIEEVMRAEAEKVLLEEGYRANQ